MYGVSGKGNEKDFLGEPGIVSPDSFLHALVISCSLPASFPSTLLALLLVDG